MFDFIKRYATATFAAMFALLLTAAPLMAQDPVTLPDTGVDVGALIGVAITGLGAIVAVVVGGYFAFLLVRKGMRWGARALG